MYNNLDRGFLVIDKTKKICIYGNDEKLPHCHVTGLGKDGNKEVCVRLDKPEYFYHGETHSKFTKDEKELFITFVNKSNEFNVRHWNWLASTWDGMCQDYPTMKKIRTTKIPDYNKLPTED